MRRKIALMGFCPFGRRYLAWPKMMGPLKRLHSPQVDGHQLRIIMEISWKYDENIMEIWWKYDGNMMEIWWKYDGNMDFKIVRVYFWGLRASTSWEHMDLGWHNCHYSLWSSKQIVLLGWSSGVRCWVLVVTKGFLSIKPPKHSNITCVAMIHPREFYTNVEQIQSRDIPLLVVFLRCA
jgi:hypothetical protein